jgi:hydroxyethylthiazole kinase-like uncharacterized protein yjeF
VLVIGGSAETPGSVLLAAISALRAGAGRVHIATTRSTAGALAVAMPEARVTPMSEATDGTLSAASISDLLDLVDQSDTVLIGTGMIDAESSGDVLATLIPLLSSTTTTLVIDAGLLGVLAHQAQAIAAMGERTVLLPNPGEMAQLLDSDPDAIDQDPVGAIRNAAGLFRCTIALRGGETFVASPGSEIFVERSGHAALATSGSGDVLAGALAGLSARGASPLYATLWAVHAHARAGACLAERDLGLGLLARELPDLLPAILNDH